MDPERPFRLVTGVLREALRASGTGAVALAGEGPEASLLRSWMGRAEIPFLSPPPLATEAARRLVELSLGAWPPLAGEGEGPGPEREEAREEALEAWEISGLAARALVSAGDALLLGAESKTLLLLGCHPSGAAVLPLGDLYASDLLELAGGCTLPGSLRLRGADEIRAVDEALRSYLERGEEAASAFGSLPELLQVRVSNALLRARGRVSPQMLIPKLGRATLGTDLDL